MYLHQVAVHSFLLLRAHWPVGKARQLIQRLKPTHVIVHRITPPDHYFLYTSKEALDLSAHEDSRVTVHKAFNLDSVAPTPALDAYANAEIAPDRSVVLEEGRVMGFFDATMPPAELLGRKATARRGDGEPVPCSLAADFPDPVPLGQTVSLLISLTPGPGAHPTIPLALPLGATVDIVVQPQRGFALVGTGEGQLVVSEEETLPLQFRLRATELGPGRLRILAFHQGQPLAAMSLAPSIVAESQTAESRRSSHEQALAMLSVRQPDLSLLILEHATGGRPAFTFRLTALDPHYELYLKRFGPVQLYLDPLEYLRDFFQDIENLSLRTPRDRSVAERRLDAKGTSLFTTLIPDDLQALLWSLRDRIQTVQILSEEPWIPWELCKLQGQENGQVVEGPFLCEAFAVTRLMPGIGHKPTLKLNRIALVVPRDSDLPLASSERDYMLGLADSGRQVQLITAGYLEVLEALAAGIYDGWHFTGHGGFRAPDPNRSAMLLENQEELTPEDLNGQAQNLGRAHPLVFLNACQIGRNAMSLTDIGGWAAQFLRAGAAAFVGAYWSVYDQAAHDFARAFYERLLAGRPIGQAAQEARATVKLSGDPTWLAYTVFADPLATVSRP